MADYNIPGLRKQFQSFFWEPSATLKREGWDRLILGTDEAAAIVKAQARVADITAWRAAGRPPLAQYRKAQAAAPTNVVSFPAPAAGSGITLARLIREFELAGYPRADDEHDSVSRNSQRSYNYAFGKLIGWAGNQPANRILPENAKKYHRSLIEGNSKYVAAAVLRCAKRLYNWGISEPRLGITSNPFGLLKRARLQPRKRLWDTDRSGNDYEYFANAAEAIGRPELALAVDLYLTLGQRTIDMVKVSSDDWRPIYGLEDYQVERLASDEGPNAGEVMGFHLWTQKTDTWVTIPVAGDKRRRIEAQIARNAARGPSPVRPGKRPPTHGQPVKALLVNEYTGEPWEAGTLQRRFAEARAHAVEELGLRQFAGLQLRDLRRTCVVRMAEAGLTNAQIVSITGHSLENASLILETYMPKTIHTAAGAVVAMMDREAATANRRAKAKRAKIKLVS